MGLDILLWVERGPCPCTHAHRHTHMDAYTVIAMCLMFGMCLSQEVLCGLERELVLKRRLLKLHRPAQPERWREATE